MQNVSRKTTLNIFTALATVLLLFLILVAIQYSNNLWPDRLLRPADSMNYLFLYFGMLWFFLLVYGMSSISWTLKKKIFVGIFAGLVISMIAVIITSYMFFSNPIERLMNGIEQHGILIVIGMTLLGSFYKTILLGGWLIGVVSLLLFKILNSRLERILLIKK